MQKTIEQWLKEWEHPDAEKALEYARNNGVLGSMESSLSAALYGGFVWAHQQEGHHYWEDIYLEVINNEQPYYE